MDSFFRTLHASPRPWDIKPPVLIKLKRSPSPPLLRSYQINKPERCTINTTTTNDVRPVFLQRPVVAWSSYRVNQGNRTIRPSNDSQSRHGQPVDQEMSLIYSKYVIVPHICGHVRLPLSLSRRTELVCRVMRPFLSGVTRSTAATPSPYSNTYLARCAEVAMTAHYLYTLWIYLFPVETSLA